MEPTPPSAPLDIPVLLLAFSRYDSAERVFEAIRKARPKRFYFACDGPRNAEESVNCDRVRSLAERVDWECELITRFLPSNVGLKYGVSSAISWFFEHEPEGIVLEDDTEPLPSFFPFCQEMLQRYREEPRVWWVLGNNLMAVPGSRPAASYYFSQHGYGAPWGWAGWRRSWALYDAEMSAWPKVRGTAEWDAFFLSQAEKREAYRLFDTTWDGRIRTWDFQHDFARILHRGITIIPEHNLIRNIGFSGSGTNTVSDADPRNVDNVSEMPFPLVHPDAIVVDEARDLVYFDRFIRTSNFRLFKNAVKRVLPEQVDKAVTPVLSRIQKRLGLG
jgi:hypothetical protein